MTLFKVLRLRCICLLLAMVAMSVSAEHLHPDAALERVLGTQQVKTLGLSSSTAARPTLVYSAKSAEAVDPGCYVFSKGENSGFIIVSAEDELPALLGYSDTGTFDYESSSPAFKWWISEYARQIEYYRANSSGTAPKSVYERHPRQPIAPLLGKTQWNQGWPYNEQCPKDAGGRSVTGCVATAMAQVARRWEFPEETGIGRYTYDTDKYDSNGKLTEKKFGKLTFDYASTVFRWDKMLDNYEKAGLNPGAQTEATRAVGKLMLACGIGARMGYSSSSSGAYSNAVSRVYVEHFGYDQGIRLKYKDHFSRISWENLIYLEMEAGRPVLLSGATQDGKSAHEFVCDGADGEGCFHINWGWGGSSDGYFVLTALDPGQQGIGGAESGDGFSNGGDALTRIQPPTGRSPRLYLPVSIGKSFIYVGPTQVGSSDIVFKFSGFLTVNTQVGNIDANEGASFSLGVRVCDANGDSKHIKSSWIVDNLKCGWGWGEGDIKVNMPKGTLAEGEYKVFPAFCYTDGTWQDISMPYGSSNYCVIKVYADGSMRSLSGICEKPADLLFLSFDPASTIVENKTSDSNINVTIENSGVAPYEGVVKFWLSDSEGKNLSSIGEKQMLSIEGESVYSASIPFPVKLKAGKYYVTLTDKFGREILGEREFEVKTSSGIDDVNLDDVTVEADGECIVVVGAPADVAISVYDIKGVMVKAVKSTGAEVRIPLARNNAYVVKVGEKSYKIAL